MDLEYCEECEDLGLRTPATQYITGMGPGCGDWGCCGYEAWSCDAHLTESLASMPPDWNLTASPLDPR